MFLSAAQIIDCQMRWKDNLLSVEQIMIWEAIIEYFEVLFFHLPGESKENHRKSP
jgi:hypothetical protein